MEQVLKEIKRETSEFQIEQSKISLGQIIHWFKDNEIGFKDIKDHRELTKEQLSDCDGYSSIERMFLGVPFSLNLIRKKDWKNIVVSNQIDLHNIISFVSFDACFKGYKTLKTLDCVTFKHLDIKTQIELKRKMIDVNTLYSEILCDDELIKLYRKKLKKYF